MTMSKSNYIESLPRELLIDIVERIASYSLKDLMRVKLSSKVLNEVANEPSVYQKVILLSIPVFIWPCSVVRRCTSFLEMCRASGNLEALYRKGVVIFNIFRMYTRFYQCILHFKCVIFSVV
uniref:F-box domain-containing protein n=1 Tax=Solanum tuberosum TaxID=4113 RepID=M1DM83_SOLTU